MEKLQQKNIYKRINSMMETLFSHNLIFGISQDIKAITTIAHVSNYQYKVVC